MEMEEYVRDVDVGEELELMKKEEEEVAKAPSSLSPHLKIALRLWMIGYSSKQIEQQVGVRAAALGAAKRSVKGREYVARLEEELDVDFRRLYAQTLNVLDMGLQSADMGIALTSANMALKVMGKFVHKIEKRDLSAEDLIQKILSGELQVGARKPIEIDGVVVSHSLDDDEEKVKELVS